MDLGKHRSGPSRKWMVPRGVRPVLDALSGFEMLHMTTLSQKSITNAEPCGTPRLVEALHIRSLCDRLMRFARSWSDVYKSLRVLVLLTSTFHSDVYPTSTLGVLGPLRSKASSKLTMAESSTPPAGPTARPLRNQNACDICRSRKVKVSRVSKNS